LSRDFGLQLIFQEERGRVPWLESTEPGTGHIVAMAQNTNYGNQSANDRSATKINLNSSQDMRGGVGFQSGSTFKVFTLVGEGRVVGRLLLVGVEGGLDRQPAAIELVDPVVAGLAPAAVLVEAVEDLNGCAEAGTAAYFCEYVVNDLLKDSSWGKTRAGRVMMLETSVL